MPNWTFLALHFAHVAALALWVGGGFVVLALAIPEIRSRTPAPAVARRIVAMILARFHRMVLGCVGVLWATSAGMIFWFGRWSRWYAIQYACIAVMSVSGLVAALWLAPRLVDGVEGEGSPASSVSGDVALRDRLERWTLRSLELDLACGVVAILFS